MTASDATACSGVGGIWATIEGNDACRHPDLKRAPAGAGTGTGGGTTTFVSKVKTQVESGVKDVLEMFKWILLAATVGAVVILRMERAPDGRGELRAN